MSEAATPGRTNRGRHGAMPYSRERRALVDEGYRLDDYLQHLRAVAVSCEALNEQAMSHVLAAIALLSVQQGDLGVRYAALEAREETEDLAADRVPTQRSLVTLATQRGKAASIGADARRTRKTATTEDLRRQTSFKLPIEGGQQPTAVDEKEVSPPDAKQEKWLRRDAW